MRKSIEQQNSKGEARQIGLEIEYGGLSLARVAGIVSDLFGGNIGRVSDAVFEVKGTKLGDFRLELDAIALQEIAANVSELEHKTEESLLDSLNIHLGRLAGDAGAKIAPFEIISPPIALSEIPQMEKLRTALLKAGATDTKENFYAAFGLHLNPEVASLDVGYILRHLQSFLLLAPWLKQLHHIDVTRRVSRFIDPFPASYRELVLDEQYSPDTQQLIRDYHAHNPTRNRALDMLPLFAHLDEALVRELYGQKEKINKRPTFHYRLPNCELADEEWSFNTEWQRWLHVEELAHDDSLRQELIQQWQAHQARWFTLESEWIKVVAKAMKSNHAS